MTTIENTTEKLLANLTFESQNIYSGNNGKVVSSEILSRFQDETILNALNILKESNKTLDLLRKVLEYSYINTGVTGKRLSVNAYIKDLSDPNFINIIHSLNINYPIDHTNITIEILEDDYGSINQTTISNIRQLKEMGFKISIDDLVLDMEGNSDNVSLNTLFELLNNGIKPDNVKFDGEFLQQILNSQVDSNTIIYFNGIVRLLKNLGIKIVGEWIQNEQEGKKAKKLGIDFFQGVELDSGFDISEDNISSNSNFLPINSDLISYINSYTNRIAQHVTVAN